MKNTKDIALIGVMTSIIIIMTIVPGLGYIPIGPINATIVHIPVIIVAIVKGYKYGAILGLIFGISSLLNALLRPNITSFIFMNPLISILPRILIGILTALIYEKLKNLKNSLKYVISAAMGSLINSIGVLGLIYLLYAEKYMNALGKSGEVAFTFIGYIFVTNGIVEMILSIIIAVPISKALIKYTK